MPNRVCIFVDGENFRHAIVDLFSNFSQEQYLPHNAKWEDLFDYLTDETSNQGGQRIRTYWYVIGNTEFYPHRLPNIKLESTNSHAFNGQIEKLKNTLRKYEEYNTQINGLTGYPLVAKIKEITRNAYSGDNGQ